MTRDVEPWRRVWVEESAQRERPPVPAWARFVVAFCLGLALLQPIVALVIHR